VHPSLPANHTALADEAVAAYPDAGVGQVPEVVHVQYTTVHHEGLVADEDALWAGMKVDAVIQVDLAAQVDVGRLAQANVILHERRAIAPQNQPIGQGSHTYADQAWDSMQKKEQGLLQEVATETGGLTIDVIS
jgi:hypothetical protein